MTRAYATYFDQRYLDRALYMLATLRRQDPEAYVHALCHDELAERGVGLLGDPRIRIIRAADLLAFEPRLRAASARRRWAWYATHKPVLVRYVFDRWRETAALAYVDADTAWYASPDDVFEEIGDASIAVSPHRFPPHADKSALYGPYNAGFIWWRNDEVGARCLDDWTTDSLDWCEPRLGDGGMFMNQGYMARWPERYPGVHVIVHPGLNLARWNLENHQLSWEGDALRVDGRPLVMYHFSGLRRSAGGQWQSQAFQVTDQRIISTLYARYFRGVDGVARQLKAAGFACASPDEVVRVEEPSL